jgi:RNase adaptor protein for sRNA GlmZ degradation
MFNKDNIATTLANRINNEYSHLEQIFDRSMLPIDVAEMKSLAQYVLKTIEEADKDQYNALLISIGAASILERQ